MKRYPFAPGVITRSTKRDHWPRRAARWLVELIAVIGLCILWASTHR